MMWRMSWQEYQSKSDEWTMAYELGKSPNQRVTRGLNNGQNRNQLEEDT
jgi:hypothetical protein